MLIPERYPDKIAGVLSCYDRMILQGTLPGWCYDQGMTAFLYARQIKIFDYPQFAQVLRDEVRSNAERIAEKIVSKLSSFARSTRSVKRPGSKTSSKSVANNPVSSISSRPWKPARATSPGTIRRPERPISSTIPASACTIISTSSTKRSAYAICAFPPGRHSGSSSI